MSSSQNERLNRVLAAYGADPARWPADERAALRDLLETSDQHDLPELAGAREIDLVLSTVARPDVPHGALQNALAISEKNPKAEVVQLNTLTGPGNSWISQRSVREALPLGIALAASLLLGVFVGWDEQIGNFATVASLETPSDGLEDSLWSFDPFSLNDGEQL